MFIFSFFLLLLSLLLSPLLADDQIIPPEANYNFTYYVTSLHYPVQEHIIQTHDGYLLTYYRIQAKNTQIKGGLPVVYANHGLLDCGDAWVINFEDQAPAFILANNGFDVWIGNNRGNRYSSRHIDPLYNSSDTNSVFWDFSWQDISHYDLPAAFKYIADITGLPINYMGHSQGTVIMFAALARRDPIITKYLKNFIALAPAVFLQHSKSPILQAGGSVKGGLIMQEYRSLHNNKVFGNPDPEDRLQREAVCINRPTVCTTRVRLISNTRPKVDSLERMPIFTGHFPAGTSTRNIAYWQQMFRRDELRMFSYGKAKNLLIYGSPKPPSYDLSKIKEPVFIFAGEYDELASIKDVKKLRDQLTGSSYVRYKSYPLGHSSFVWGRNVTIFMKDVLEILGGTVQKTHIVE